MLPQIRLQLMKRISPLIPEGDLPNEEPSPEALEVGRGTRADRDYHKNYKQPSSSFVNPSGKQVVNAPSGNNNGIAGPKEAFKYDFIEHFKHIPARLHILDLLRMSPHTLVITSFHNYKC